MTTDKPRCPACGSAKHGYADCGDRWCTPREVLDLARELGPIVLDPCSDPYDDVGAEVRVVHPHHGPLSGDWPDSIVRADGLLEVPWGGLGDDGVVWLNPPYSDPAPWVAKALREADRAVLLLPANPDAKWFHELARSARASVLLLEGRVPHARNGVLAKGNRQGSALAVVSGRVEDHDAARARWGDLGVWVQGTWSYKPTPTLSIDSRTGLAPGGEFTFDMTLVGARSPALAEAVEAAYRRLGRPCSPPGATAEELACELLSAELPEAEALLERLEQAEKRVEELEGDLDRAMQSHEKAEEKLCAQVEGLEEARGELEGKLEEQSRELDAARARLAGPSWPCGDCGPHRDADGRVRCTGCGRDVSPSPAPEAAT